MTNAGRPALDLRRHAWVREMRDFRVYGTWLYNAEDEDEEPALVLVPSVRTATPICVALSAAHLYDDPKYLASQCVKFAALPGYDGSMPMATRIASLIVDHLDDLITMPEDPQEAVLVAEGSVVIAGAKRSFSLSDWVPVAAN